MADNISDTDFSNSTSTNKNDKMIKSTAVVKSSVSRPFFLQLKSNTNLNLPPSNWLSSDPYGFQRILYNQNGYSSFRMAHTFPDCAGSVDVVSDAENIKNLLKIPYTNSHISMIVHRIENTLLLDKLDIYQYLMKTSQTDWTWLRQFFRDNVGDKTCKEDRSLYVKNRSRDALREKTLISKFLYHSLGAGIVGSMASTDTNNNQNNNSNNGCDSTTTAGRTTAKGSVLKECTPRLPDPFVTFPTILPIEHSRNVVWTFEDIEMLIGTDLPIFGGGTHPCISLRLRDATKPISVLTGIDYWLDNLMSNVPEVLMCYHLNGIVQKYELIKTEDLPHLDNSKFSPNLIRDVAQSILSFLKLNATKAGHTYWLFKGKDEDVVKLYDLTSLCSEKDVSHGRNPFTVPVAMLLYRVARNLQLTNTSSGRATIRALLQNCIKLLQDDEYPEIVTSTHYMLADLYIPTGLNAERPDFESVDPKKTDKFSTNDEDESDVTTKYLLLDPTHSVYDTKFVNNYQLPPPISGGVEERCRQALQHIWAGFSCLKYFPEPGKRHQNRVDDVLLANPTQPIPMREAPSSSSGSASSKKSRNTKTVRFNSALKQQQQQTESMNNNTDSNSGNGEDLFWEEHLKILLYQKAQLVYAALAATKIEGGAYGEALRLIGLQARCQILLQRLRRNLARSDCTILDRAGYCYSMLVEHWAKIDSYRNQFQRVPDDDQRMTEQLERDEQQLNIYIGTSPLKHVFVYDFLTIEQVLLQSVECYEGAARAEPQNVKVGLHLAHSWNETAVMFLSKAKSAINAEQFDTVLVMCKKAEQYFRRALEHFERTKDVSNGALLNCNLGQLHQCLMYAYAQQTDTVTEKERQHFGKSFEYFRQALQTLGEREPYPHIWDGINWHFSSSLFAMATRLQDFSAKTTSKSDAEKEVIEMLQKALKYCDLNKENPKLPLYQLRAGSIHLRIGRLYHNHVLNANTTDNSVKRYVQLVKINLEKAAKYFLQTSNPLHYFQAQMERVALSERLSEGSSAPATKIKHLQNCIAIILEMSEMLQLIVDKTADVDDADDETMMNSEVGINYDKKEEFNNCYAVIKLAKNRLHFVLKSLIKLYLYRPNIGKDTDRIVAIYKDCFRISLVLTDDLNRTVLVQKFLTVLKKIQELCADM